MNCLDSKIPRNTSPFCSSLGCHVIPGRMEKPESGIRNPEPDPETETEPEPELTLRPG